MARISAVAFTLFLLVGGIEAFNSPAPAPSERIVYAISPLGVSEYSDWGKIPWQGKTVNLTTFKTQVMGFADTETIYSDPQTYLPLRVERDITKWIGKEYITEDYDQKKNTLTIKKFVNGKKVQELVFKEDAPFQNAILLPFSLRHVPDLKVGSTILIRLPNRFRVVLASVEDVQTPAGTFKAYRFSSIPNKFEIWISKDDARIPVKIKGESGLGYTLMMRERVLAQRPR